MQGRMKRLPDALPDLFSGLESALAQVGRGDLLRQLGEASIARWTYDDFSDTAYVFLGDDRFDPSSGERLSLYDELGVNVDCDERGQVRGLEVLDGRRVSDRLEGA
jgi:uncharacterized protein YuzE